MPNLTTHFNVSPPSAWRRELERMVANKAVIFIGVEHGFQLSTTSTRSPLLGILCAQPNKDFGIAQSKTSGGQRDHQQVR